MTWNDDYTPDDAFISPIIKSVPVTVHATVGGMIDLPTDDDERTIVPIDDI